MVIIVEDSRQKVGYHDNVLAYCSSRGIRLIRTKLDYGDYVALEVPEDIEDVDEWIMNIKPVIHSRTNGICVDTKYGMAEVYSNLVHDHARVAAECDGAYSNGLRLVFLVEEPGIKSVDDVHKWVNPQFKRYKRLADGHKIGKYMGTKLPKPPIESDRLETMMKTFADHHHCEWRFCTKMRTGKVLMEILSND